MSAGTAAAASWRVPSRLARRETRRRPGRTLLVALLVGVPVLAMTLGSIYGRTGPRSAAWEFALRYGGSDVAAVGAQEDAATIDSPRGLASRIAALMPPGSSATTLRASLYIPIVAAGDDRVVTATIAEIVDQRGEASFYGMDGDARPAAGDVWASESVLDRYDLEVGDELELRRPQGSWTIVGTGKPAADHDADVLVFGTLPIEQFRRDAGLNTVVLINLPGDDIGQRQQFEQTLTDGRINVAIESPDYANGTTSENGELNSAELAWGWVAGAIALAAVGIIISAAFATSARRQLVTVGQLSANGASQQVIVRALGMQGLWTGLVGAAGGVAGGVALAVVGRGTAERIAGRDFPPTFIAPIDLVVIAVTGVLAAVIAATIPARSAARVPTLTALAGRRPLSAVPRRLVPIGVALFGLGVLLLVLAAGNTSGGHLPAATAVLGGIAVMIGMCCCSPVAIDAMSRVTARLGGARRFAGRSLSRTRARSAAIVTAIGVTGAIAISGASVVSAVAQEDESEPRTFPADVVTATPIVDYELVPQADAVVSPELRDRVAEAVPGIRWHHRRVVSPGDRGTQEGGMRRGRLVLGDGIGIVVADEATMDLYELPQADRDALERYGALLLDDWYGGEIFVEEGSTAELAPTVEVRLRREGGNVDFTVARRTALLEATVDENGQRTMDPDVVRGRDLMMVTDELLTEHDLDAVIYGGFGRAPDPLTANQRERLAFVASEQYPVSGLATTYRDVPRTTAGSGWNLDWQYDRPWSPAFVIQLLIVAVATFLVLVVLAIGLSLAATESRDERDVLVAVGAKPTTLRRMAGVKAVVLTLTGLALAVPTGLIPVLAISGPVDLPFVMPWALLAVLLLALPLVVGVAAWFTSTIAQRVRPVTMSNLAVD
ncbi:MAG: hypothetical protein M3Q72_00360 [Actinomycetota bacterium]|nr:hypothetical protein [Actinomycetota bacterium]